MIQKSPTIDESLAVLCERAKVGSVSIQEIIHLLSNKGRSLILIFLVLPFCQPLSLPGLSTVFGLIIAFMGIRMSFGKSLWLPKFLLRKHISSEKIQKMAGLILRTVRRLKFLIHPRLETFCQHRAMHIFNGMMICLLGLFLALPLPIPLTNLIAAWPIFFIALGILENDGVFVIIGHSIIIGAAALLLFFFLF